MVARRASWFSKGSTTTVLERSNSRRSVFFSTRALVAIPYQSSKVTSRTHRLESLREWLFQTGFEPQSAPRSSGRCKRSCPADSSFKNGTLHRRGLVGPVWKRLGIQFIESAEQFRRVLDDRFEKDALAHPAYAHRVTLKAELPRQPHGRAAAVLEEPGEISSCDGGVCSPQRIYHRYIPRRDGTSSSASSPSSACTEFSPASFSRRKAI
jgi:hypothetical protein